MKTQSIFVEVFSSRLSKPVKVITVFIIIVSLLGLQAPKENLAAPASLAYLGSLGVVSSKSSETTLVIDTLLPVTTGNDIVVALGTDPNSNLQVTVTDSAGNTYQQVALVINSGQIRTYLFAAYDVNAMPVGSDITISMSVAVTANAAVAALFDGLADNGVFDQVASATASNTSTPSSGATPTTTQADELLIGVIGTEGPVGDTAGTWQNSFLDGPRTGTTVGTADTNITIALGYRVVDTVGTYTAAKTGITARDWGAIIGTFKADLVANKPLIALNGTLDEFLCLPGGTSVEQSYGVSGSNLTGNITVTSPDNFEISLTSGTGFTDQIILPQEEGIVSETDIFVRFGMSVEGNASGMLQHVSAGATTRNIPVSGTSAPLNPVDFNILLGRPEDDSITVNIYTDYAAEFYIDYGTVSGSYPLSVGPFTTEGAGSPPTFPIVPTELVIDGLSTNTQYFYRIRYHRTGITEWNLGAEYSFVTQRAPGESFVFTVISDSHLGQYGGQTADEQELYRVSLQNVLSENPDFHIDLGDTYAMDPSPLGTGMTDKEAHDAYLVQRPFLEAIGHSVPFYSVLGNHENEEGWNFDDVFTAPDQSLALVGMKYRKLFYPNPIPDGFYSGNVDLLDPPIGGDGYQEDYWAWTWGDALFIVLDPFHYSMTWPDDDGQAYGGEGQDGEVSGDRWDWSLGIEQYLWLKNTLQTSSAEHKFVFTHHVTGGTTPYGRGGLSAADLFEWGGKNADGSWGWDTHRPASEGWTVPVHQLMVDNGVDIFFHGHDHMYAYEEVDGIAYVEVAKPDDAGYDWEPYSYGYNENLYPDAISILQNSGYLRVTVTPNQVTVDYVRSYLPGDGTNKTVSHSFTAPLTSPEGLLGDVNDDGQANSTDALLILSGDVGINISSFCPVNCGDANGDGIVNSTDALILMSFDVGLTVPYPLEQPGCSLSVTQPAGCSAP